MVPLIAIPILIPVKRNHPPPNPQITIHKTVTLKIRSTYPSQKSKLKKNKNLSRTFLENDWNDEDARDSLGRYRGEGGGGVFCIIV